MQGPALAVFARKSASLAILCTLTLLVVPPPALAQVGVTQRVSTGLDGTAANGASFAVAISADGCVVAFSSGASDLVLNDNNGANDLFAFVCDPPPGVIRISLQNGGGAANGASFNGSIMGASVRSAAIESAASNLVTGDTNSAEDIFVVSGNVEAGTPTVTRVSLPNLADQGMLGTQANSNSSNPSMGGNERLVAFESNATNLVLGDTNTFNDVFVHDRQTAVTTRVSVPNLADQGMLGTQANEGSFNPVMSANGRFVAFESLASNLVIGDTNGLKDIFVHDRQTGATTRVSVPNLANQGTLGTQANGGASSLATISADGRFVAFESNAQNLVLNDTSGPSDIFVHDRQTGATERVSVPNLADQGTLGTEANSTSFFGARSLSLRGRYVVFSSSASNLVLNDTNNLADVFVHDRQTGQTVRVSVAGGTQGNASAFNGGFLSADGRFVAFSSDATNLAANDDNNARDVFLAQTALTPDPLPIINNGGVVNAASFAASGPVAPGSIAAVFGTNLAQSTAVALATPLPTSLGEGEVDMDISGMDNIVAVPMFFNSTMQSNVQIPWETALIFTGAWGVLHGTSGVEPSQQIEIQQFAPGIFATNQQGNGQGAVLIANTAMLAAPMGAFPGSRPAVRGQDFLEIYWTGGGPVTNQPATGAAAVANPLSQTTTTPTLTIGGVPTPVLFSGLAPGFVGLYVVTCQVPAMAPTGNAVDVVLAQGGVQSNIVTIAIASQ
ncbi:MAG TPA: hypothetical protein VNN18_04035 [Candidatus Xenobia bacterium]|nr:hypothetical protein [Candidatus Xenobia bacterium]